MWFIALFAAGKNVRNFGGIPESMERPTNVERDDVLNSAEYEKWQSCYL